MASEPAGRIAGRYSSLFTLPTFKGIITYLALLCLLGGTILTCTVNPTAGSILLGLAYGILLLATSTLTDYAIIKTIMKGEPILDFRRCSFLSLVSSLILTLFITMANLTLKLTGGMGGSDLWVKVTSLGLFAALTLRFIVFFSVSSLGTSRAITSSTVQPVLFMMVASLPTYTNLNLSLMNIIHPVIATATAYIGVYAYTRILNKPLGVELNFRPLELFKAFLANWTENLNEPLERIFEEMGEEREIKISLLKFKGGSGLKALMIVPLIHPGPFKNVGSSNLPGVIQEALEEKLKCVVSVPHGLSGHGLDLTSHRRCRDVLEEVLAMIGDDDGSGGATPFIRLDIDGAKVSCQVFGKCALLTLTLAPEMMEDLPPELDEEINREAERLGFEAAIVIDAHNSINGSFNLRDATRRLRRAAAAVLKKAGRLKPSRFKVGASKVLLEGFGVKEGIGPGGITAITTEVGNRRFAYVVIDGNNMVSNLRSEILARLKRLGIDDGEVLTTDTHIVNGVVMVDRGYYPIGEAIPRKTVIEGVERAVKAALDKLEPAEASWCVRRMRNVKVIGERQIESLCRVADEVADKARRTAIILFPTVTAILIAILTII